MCGCSAAFPAYTEERTNQCCEKSNHDDLCAKLKCAGSRTAGHFAIMVATRPKHCQRARA